MPLYIHKPCQTINQANNQMFSIFQKQQKCKEILQLL